MTSSFRNIVSFTVILTCLRAAGAEPWRDKVPHRILSVTVDEAVSLEVLDWGGTGRPLVLLAGLGHTAHIFDAFAPSLTDFFHVYAITRRGFGSSTHASSGYTQSRLTDDVMAVVDHFHLTGTVLAGHSFAGQELTAIGIRRPDRIAGLVYLDAAADDLSGLQDEPKLQVIMRRLPQPRPTSSDLKSFSALQAWWTRTYGITPPEAELRNMYRVTPNGGVGKDRTAEGAWEAAMNSVSKPDYGGIRVPILAVYAVPRSARDLPPWLRTDDELKLRAIDEAYSYGAAARERAFKAFRRAAHSKIVKLHGADHYVFLSHANALISELQTFVSSLR